MTCERCGRANRESARFCDGCGAPLHVATESDDARKVVTVVFADLAGSTPLQERLDAESARQLMDRYYAAIRAAVDDHHGTVVKLLGDGVMAVFGVPQVGEDDALRAVRAAHDMQSRFAAVAATRPGLSDDFGLRVGINTGEVVVSTGDDDVVGDPVNVAARLQSHAGVGEILLGAPTWRLVHGLVTLESAGDLELKGRAEHVRAYRLVALDPPVVRAATRLVGRGAELERLEHRLDATIADGARLTVVLGSPGLGKTRLLDELAGRVSNRATVLTGRCDATGLATFAPIAEALRAAAGLADTVPAEAIRTGIAALVPDDEPERDRVVDRAAALLGAGPPASPEETFWAVRRLLGGLGRVRPVVLVLDDLHWAEPLLLDLVEHVVEWSSHVPLSVVGAARPELREMRSSLASPGGPVEVVVLDALDAGAATQLAADVLGADELPAAVAGRVLAASEGNPLFVRELVRMLVDDGVLQREGERWHAATELADVEMPPTIHALLASRLERLRPEQRAVIERAAVIGRQFTRAALDHLLSADVAPALDDHLDALRRRELVEPDASWFLGEPVLRFGHALIRDAAYRRLLKGTRAELHERYADWLGDRLDAGVPDRDDTLGWHLEQAHAYLVELEQDDEHVHELGRRAAEHLARAGRHALERDDLTVAAGLLGRALDRLEPDAPGRADLQLQRCEALLAAGEVALARHAVDALATGALGDPRLEAWYTAFVAQLEILTEPERLPEIVRAIAPVADAMHAAGDVSGEAKAHYVHALALSRLGQVGAAEAALDRALAAARAAGNRRLANAVLAGAPLAALWGPSPVTRASGRCLDVVRVLRITAGAPAVEAVALRCQAVLEALRGRVDAARRMIASARRTLEDLGLTHRLLETEVFAGLVELYDDDPGAAEARLRPAFEQLRARGLGGEAAQAAALLGRALLLQGRDAEADALGHDAEALAGADLKAAIAWRGVRAEAAARRGDDAAALALARAAVDVAANTDALLDHADARLVLSAVLRAVGDEAAAAEESQRAAALYEAKGATVLAERARGGAEPVRDVSATRVPATSVRRVRENLATENSRQIAHAMSVGDHELLESQFAPGCTYFQHDLGQTVDRETHLRTLKAAPAGGRADIEILATPNNRLALERVSWWFPSMPVGASTAGEASLVLLVVTEVDERGRASWTAGYSVDQLEAALAALARRLGRPLRDALLAGRAPEDAERPAGNTADDPEELAAPTPTFENAATLFDQRFVQAWAARDWQAVEATYADCYRMIDRRSMNRIALDRDDALTTVRQVFDVGASEWLSSIVATRGQRLALHRYWVRFADRSAGDSEVEMLVVAEADPSGAAAANVIFDPDDLDAAYDELDARYAEGEGAAAARLVERGHVVRRAVAERDWSAAAELFRPDVVLEDHRQLGRGTLTRTEYIGLVRELIELVPHARLDFTHMLAADRGRYLVGMNEAAEGRDGAFEVPYVVAGTFDDEGRVTRGDAYSIDQLDQAWAHYHALAPAQPFENAVTRQRERFVRAWRDGDWDDVATTFAEDHAMHDRRSLVRIDYPTGGDLIDLQRIFDTQRMAEAFDLVATRGERLALFRSSITVSRRTDPDRPGVYDSVGPAEIGRLVLHEVDDREQFVLTEVFDPDDLDAAFDELDARYAAGEAAPHAARWSRIRQFADSYGRVDLEEHAGGLADDYVLIDHRPLGWGRLDKAAYLEQLRVINELSPDAVSRLDHVPGLCERGSFVVTTTVGDPASGRYEIPVASVAEYNSGGQLARSDYYSLDQLDEAWERYRSLADRASAETIVVRAVRRYDEALARRDLVGLRDLCSDAMEYIDRRRHSRFFSDREAFLQSARIVLADDSARVDRSLVETAGEHLVLMHTRVTSGRESVDLVEGEILVVFEADDAGRIVTFVSFDVDDRASAFAEMEQRFLAGEGAGVAAAQAPIVAFSDAFATRDWPALRDTLAEDFLASDHRLAWMGSSERDDYVASMRILTELSPDVTSETVQLLAWDDHGRVAQTRVTGTQRDTGPFENAFIWMLVTDADRVRAIEVWDLADVDAALAAFEEGRPGS